MSLRNEIKEIIESSINPEDASTKILIHLEERVGLDGNGWFDDDPEFQTILRDGEESDDDENP